MPKTIIHACGSPLVRPNGIVRYINAVIERQRAQGHHVIFISDAQPSEIIAADQIVYYNKYSTYKPNMKNGHVWLPYDGTISDQIYNIARELSDPDLIIVHDLHSYEGVSRVHNNGIFIQHESDIMNAGSRYSYMDDAYLEQHRNVVNTTNWRIGMTVESDNISPKRPVYTPYPFRLASFPKVEEKTKKLLYIGDTSERKGAKEFMDTARKLNIRPTVITHEPDAELFKDADVYSFTLNERASMFELMRQHKVAYIPSKNECFSLAILECLQFMPTIVDKQYSWTRHVEKIGATITTGDAIMGAIQFYLDNPKSYSRDSLETWCKNADQLWTNLST